MRCVEIKTERLHEAVSPYQLRNLLGGR
jgi:hypothetical protein